MASGKILALVLAGAQDLLPIGLGRMRSSMSLGGYRVVDFALSNLVNSGIDSIYVLAGSDAEILTAHVREHWTFPEGDAQRFIRVIPQQRQGRNRDIGTSSAIAQLISLVERHAPDLVAVFAGDQVCRMDVRDMVAYHCERGADLTIATVPVPLADAPLYDVVVAGYNGEVWNFQERPDIPTPIPFDPARAFASMGNYLVNAGVLVDGMKQVVQGGEADLGRGLVPQLLRTHQVCAYDFACNRVPGAPSDDEPYWRSIGTLQAYLDASQDIEGPAPRLRLHNSHWPILPLHGKTSPNGGTSGSAWLSKIDMLQLEHMLVYH